MTLRDARVRDRPILARREGVRSDSRGEHRRGRPDRRRTNGDENARTARLRDNAYTGVGQGGEDVIKREASSLDLQGEPNEVGFGSVGASVGLKAAREWVVGRDGLLYHEDEIRG
jgi:hypothetical protein